MFHTAVFANTPAAAETNFDTPAISDGWLTVQNNHFIAQQPMKLAFGGLLSDATPLNLRINTPHFRAVSIPSIQPVKSGTTNFGLLGQFCVFPQPWLTVPAIDEIAAEVTCSAAGTLQTVAAIGLHDGNMAIPQGDIFTLRATATITAVVGSWTRGNITLDQTLPAGTYSVIGMAAYGATLAAARLRFQGYLMLPGVLGLTNAQQQADWRFRMGRMGELGRFPQTAQPSLEIYCLAADTSQTIFLDVVKVS